LIQTVYGGKNIFNTLWCKKIIKKFFKKFYEFE